MFRALFFFVTSFMWWQQPTPPVPDDPEVEFVCPMDKEVRSKLPGKCPICGMTLVANLPDPHEFPVRITTAPKIPKPGEETTLVHGRLCTSVGGCSASDEGGAMLTIEPAMRVTTGAFPLATWS